MSTRMKPPFSVSLTLTFISSYLADLTRMRSEGAAFYGATQSRQFKTKATKVLDVQLYDVQTSYLAEGKSVPGTSFLLGSS